MIDSLLTDLVAQFGLVRSDSFEQDGGIVAVPNSGIYTSLVSRTFASYVHLSFIEIGVYDAAALPVVTWQLAKNGITVYPWEAQRLAGGQLVVPVRIGRVFLPYEKIDLMAAVPASSVVGFDVVGKVIGETLR